jgi:hypothetical protein
MQLWPLAHKSRVLEDILLDDHVAKFWTKKFQTAFNKSIDTWDYQWMFACWMQNGLSILPDVNLISNIGFGEDATHTTTPVCNNLQKVQEIHFPLRHPNFIVRDHRTDEFIQRTRHGSGLIEKLTRKARKATIGEF